MFAVKKIKRWNTHLTFLYPIQWKEDLSPRHDTHNILKTILLIVVLIWHSFPFLSLKEQCFPGTRSWWAAVCIEHYSVPNGHWLARPLGNTLTEMERLKPAAQQGKSLSESSWDISQKETVTLSEPWRSVFPIQVYFPCLTAPWKSTELHWTWLSSLGGMPFQLLLMHTKRNFVRQC